MLGTRSTTAHGGSVRPVSDPDSPPTARVLAVLEYLAATDMAPGTAALSERLGITRSTARLVLSALERAGYVERDTATRGYRIGRAAVGLGHASEEHFPLLRTVLDVLRRISNELRVGCAVTARSGDDLLILGRTGSREYAPGFPRSGVRLPFAAPFGTPFAASLPDDQVDRWMTRAGPSARQRETLSVTLKNLRDRGYVVRGITSRFEAAISSALAELIDTGDPSRTNSREAALRAVGDSGMGVDLSGVAIRGHTPETTADAYDISMPVAGQDGLPELAVIVWVPGPVGHEEEVERMAKRVRLLMDSATELTFG